MKPILFTLLIASLITTGIQAQNLSLSQCLAKGKANYPLLAGKNYVQNASALKLKNLQTQYYPQFDLTGQVTWQNDVTHLSISGSPFKIEPPAKDQYKAYVDVKQVIFDGGVISASKNLERMRSETDMQSIEVDLYAIRSRIIDSYFLILSIDRQTEQINFNINDLNNRLAETSTKVKNGTALQSNADLLEVEILKLQQNLSSLNEGRNAALNIMSEFTGEKTEASAILDIPTININDTTIYRPELALMEKQRQQLQASENLGDKTRMPKLAAFGQMGYGNPGFNMMLNSFEPFYMVGLRLNWNIWDWKKNANDKEALQQQQLIIDTKQQAFLRQINVTKAEIESRIRRTQQALELDGKIITLRENIRLASQSQLNNGVITSSDYITRLNDATMAKLNEALHRIELSKATVELANLVGINL